MLSREEVQGAFKVERRAGAKLWVGAYLAHWWNSKRPRLEQNSQVQSRAHRVRKVRGVPVMKGLIADYKHFASDVFSRDTFRWLIHRLIDYLSKANSPYYLSITLGPRKGGRTSSVAWGRVELWLYLLQAWLRAGSYNHQPSTKQKYILSSFEVGLGTVGFEAMEGVKEDSKGLTWPTGRMEWPLRWGRI